MCYNLLVIPGNNVCCHSNCQTRGYSYRRETSNRNIHCHPTTSGWEHIEISVSLQMPLLEPSRSGCRRVQCAHFCSKFLPFVKRFLVLAFTELFSSGNHVLPVRDNISVAIVRCKRIGPGSRFQCWPEADSEAIVFTAPREQWCLQLISGVMKSARRPTFIHAAISHRRRPSLEPVCTHFFFNFRKETSWFLFR